MPIIAGAFAVVSGLIVLAGYFVPALQEAQQLLLNWAVVLAGAAVIVGVFNLLSCMLAASRRRKRVVVTAPSC